MLGRPIKLEEFHHYVAQTISAFDIVTLEKVHDDLSDINRVLEILGPDWDYLVTDRSPGAMGNLERFAIVYYAPRVQFAHVSGEVVLLRDELIDGEQFARKPLLASFRSGGLEFRICTAHLTYGRGALEQTAKEAAALARHLVRSAARRDQTGSVLSANLNLRAKDSAVVAALRREGVDLPAEMLHPSVALSRSYAGAIGFVSPRGDLRLGPSRPNSGVVDLASVLFRAEHAQHYRRDGLYESPAGDGDAARHFLRWGTLNLSEHMPLWAELAA